MTQNEEQSVPAVAPRQDPPARGPRWFAPRLRSVVAARVVLLAAPALAVVVLTAWCVCSSRLDARRSQGARLESVTRAMASSIAELSGQADLGAFRRLAAAGVQDPSVSRVSVRLTSGAIIADSDASQVSYNEIPGPGDATAGPEQPTVELADAGSNTCSARIRAAGRADLDLFVFGAHPGADPLSAARPAAEPLLIGGVLLALSFVAWRYTHRLLRPLAEIQRALRDLRGGEPCADALLVHPDWGEAAHGWNDLIGRLIELRARADGAAPVDGSKLPVSDQSVQRACDAMSIGVVVLESDLRVRFANSAAGVLLGRKRGDLVGGLFTEAAPDAGVVEAINSLNSPAAGRRRVSVECGKGAEAGQSVLRFNVCRIAGDADGSILVLVDDVTQQRAADRARDSFVAQATHELRTPLTNIRLYVESLLEDDAEPAARGRALNIINKEARRLERIVGDMLSVSEIEAGSLKLRSGDVRLDAVLKDLLADYEAQAAEKGVTLRFDLPPKLPVLRGDRDKITVALHNLLGNALKYTPEGGTVTVQASDGPTSCWIRVTDTGLGIAPEEHERVFERFFRSADQRVSGITGTGLGLTLAREVARLHGGDITLESQLNQGSAFTLTLPHFAAAA